jgi:hypothetical protein
VVAARCCTSDMAVKQFGSLAARFTRKLSHHVEGAAASAIAVGGLTLATEDIRLSDLVDTGEFAETLRQRSSVGPGCADLTSVPVVAPT